MDTPRQPQPDNILVSSQGGRDNKAHAVTFGDTMVLTNNTVNAFRVAYNKTDIDRIDEPIGFSVLDVGVDGTVTSRTTGGERQRRRLPAWRRHGERSALHDASDQVSDDSTLVWCAPSSGIGANASYWTSLSQANHPLAGPVHLQRHDHGLLLADFYRQPRQLDQATPNSS